MISRTILLLPALAMGALLHCNDAPATQDFSDAKMTDGTVLEVSPDGHVMVGARASLVVASDGSVHIKGPFSVDDALVVRDGKVFIKNLQQGQEAARRIEELESRIARMERRLIALEEEKAAENYSASAR
ncbi:MAG: hypothetical protein CMF59_14640 [Leptospiraceae bacterium]|nr:hypothetical protein [Leptospiraceae bacterium]